VLKLSTFLGKFLSVHHVLLELFCKFPAHWKIYNS